MSMNDPGWDDAGFENGDSSGWDDHSGSEASSGSSGTSGGGGNGPRPPWEQPRVLAIAGGAIVVVIVVLLVVLLTHGGGSSGGTVSDQQPSRPVAAVSTAPRSAASTHASEPTSAPANTVSEVTVDDFDKKADGICRAYKGRLTKAEKQYAHTMSLKTVITDYSSELHKIEGLKKPTEDPDVVKKWFKDVNDTFGDLKAHNLNAFNASVLHSDTYAGQLGMHICNYGH